MERIFREQWKTYWFLSKISFLSKELKQALALKEDFYAEMLTGSML